jgi:hypothetical protein
MSLRLPLASAATPTMKVPLAGPDAAGHATETILSEVGVVLLRMFSMAEACMLRLVCRVRRPCGSSSGRTGTR